MKGSTPSVRVEVPVSDITTMHSDQSRSDLHLRHFCYATLLIVLVIFSIARIRLRNMPLERDEGEYAYAGQLILQGVPPYRLAYNMKLPGTYAAYAVMMAAFGQTVAGIRIGMLVVLIGNTLLVFLLGRRLFGILAGTVAAASYTILANRLTTVSLNGHATHFIVLGALAGTLLLLRAIETQNTVALFSSGLFLGIAFLMKQHGILFTIFGFLFWAWTAWKQRTGWRRMVSQGSVLAAGMILPFLLTCLIMWYGGVFRNFWFWTVSYGAAYEKENKFAEGWRYFRAMESRFARPLNIWIPAGLGLTALFWDRRGRAYKVFMLNFALFSFLAVFPGFWFRPHYFLVIYPAVALLAGLGISAVYDCLRSREFSRTIVWLPIALFALSYASALRGQRKYLFEMSPERVHREMYIGDGFPEAAAVGNYIREHSSTQDRVAVLGSEPEIYFLSRRRSATGYIYMYPLMEKQKFALRMQNDMIHQIEETQPKIVVFVDTLSGAWDNNWNASEPHMNLFLWIRDYLGAHYDLMAEIPIQGAVDNLWGLPCRYYIFQRN